MAKKEVPWDGPVQHLAEALGKEIEIPLAWGPLTRPMLEIYRENQDPEVLKKIEDHFLQCARVADAYASFIRKEEEKNND